ncbi:MAG: S41 family peptidase [Phycisphaerales bacterium]|nr:S41 family peptidase [Phycisphaerales bacterium]
MNARAPLTFGSLGLLLTVLAPLAAPSPVQAITHLAYELREPELPKTTAGRCADDFFAMVRDSSPDAIRAFESRWASKKRLAARTMEDRFQRIPQMRDEWAGGGGFAITGVESISDLKLLVSVESPTIAAEIDFQFDDAEPGKLLAVMVEGSPPGHAALPLTAESRTATINGAAKALRDAYVFPETADKMAQSILAKLAAGEYDTITNERALARRLTDDLRAVSHDLHLGVRFAPADPSAPTAPDEDAPPSAEDRAWMRRENYAFRKAEVLPGNIGYLKFDAFVDDEEARATAAAAMSFLSHCDAIVYDLRENGGGSPAMIQFLTSYLFSERTHLNDMIDRTGAVVEEYWTLDTVPGSPLPKNLPVYVLTSSRTFSGAEEFSYNLKNLKRATIIGETTGGGAHPVRGERISDRFMVMVPFMRANNPISKTNWEGTGVDPDIKVPAADALDRALTEARKSLPAR